MNGSRDGFPLGDKFEGFSHSAKDKPESENPDVNIPPSAHEPYKSLKRFKLVDEFADSEINAPLAKPSMPSATSNRSKAEGAWQLAGNLKMPGMAIHRDTWNNTWNECSIFPLLVVSTYYECSGNDIAKQRCKTYRSLKRTLT